MKTTYQQFNSMFVKFCGARARAQGISRDEAAKQAYNNPEFAHTDRMAFAMQSMVFNGENCTHVFVRVIIPGKEILHGFWICAEGILTEPVGEEKCGKIEQPDDDGVNWYEGEGYAMSRKGRELDYIQGRPKWRPELTIDQVKFDTSDWEQPSGSDNDTTLSSSELYATNPMGAFFREVCRRFYDTAGGMEGYLAIGGVMGYAAAPEIYAKQKNFPSEWVSGQMGSGKSTFCSWLASLQGLSLAAGMGLISKNVTAVGIACANFLTTDEHR